MLKGMAVPPANAVRVLAPISADDLAVMRWTLITVQATIQRRLKSRRFRSAALQEQAVKFEETINRFDRGYLETEDVVVLLTAFYALEENYPVSGSVPAPSQGKFKTVLEKARRLPYLEPINA